MIGGIPNPLQSFQWGDSGQAMTPDQVARRRAMAALLQQQSASTAPVAHWTQAAARGLGGFLAGRSERIATRAENEGLASADEYVANNPILSALMGETGQALGMPNSGPTPAPMQQAPMQAMPGQGPTLSYGNATPAALDVIRKFEGFRETPYWDVNALRTGYGSDTVTLADGSVVPVGQGTRVSREDAERDLARRVETEFMPRAARAAGAAWDGLNANQKAALTSITYNYGSLPSPVARALQSGGDVTGAIMSLSSHNDGVNARRRAEEAQLFAGGGGVTTNAAGMIQAPAQAPSGVIAALAGAQGNPWVAQKYGPVLEALMGQEMGRQDAAYQQSLAQSDPMYQAQLQGQMLQNQQATMTDPWAGVQEINGQLVQMGPNGPQVIGDYRDQGGTADNQTERDIALLGEIGIPRDEAIRITQLNQVSRDPLTGEVVIVDRASGLPVGMPNAAPQVPAEPAPAAAELVPPAQGLQFPSADSSFGAGGAARRYANTISDVAGLGVPFPEQQETQSNFNVLRETLRTNIASSYGSRPSNFVLQQIDELLPRAGSVSQGPEGARRDLEALQRVMEAEREAVGQSLDRRLSPNARQEVEAQIHSLDTSLAQIGTALGAFGAPRGSDAAQAGAPPEGVDQRVWEFMTPEERALWQ